MDRGGFENFLSQLNLILGERRKTGNFWFFGFPELATMCKIDSKSFQIHLDPPVEGVRMANIEVEVASTRCMPPAVPKLFN